MSSDFYKKYLQDEVKHQNYVIKFLEAKIHRLEDENNKLNDSLEAVMVRDGSRPAKYLVNPLDKNMEIKYKQALEIIAFTPLEYGNLKRIARDALEAGK